MSLPVWKSGACVLRRIHRARRGSKSFCPRAAVRWYRWPAVCYYLFILPSITSLSLSLTLFVNTRCLQGEDPSICTMMQIIYIRDKERNGLRHRRAVSLSRTNITVEYYISKISFETFPNGYRVSIPKNNYITYRERRIIFNRVFERWSNDRRGGWHNAHEANTRGRGSTPLKVVSDSLVEAFARKKIYLRYHRKKCDVTRDRLVSQCATYRWRHTGRKNAISTRSWTKKGIVHPSSIPVYVYIRTIYVYIYVYTYKIRIYICIYVQYMYIYMIYVQYTYNIRIYIYRKAYGYREKILHFRIGVAKKRGSDGRSGGSPLKRRREGGGGGRRSNRGEKKRGRHGVLLFSGRGKKEASMGSPGFSRYFSTVHGSRSLVFPTTSGRAYYRRPKGMVSLVHGRVLGGSPLSLKGQLPHFFSLSSSRFNTGRHCSRLERKGTTEREREGETPFILEAGSQPPRC